MSQVEIEPHPEAAGEPAWNNANNSFTRTTTSASELRPMKAGRAIVIGASVAGLLAAAAARESFDEVVIIDRDLMPTDPVARAGVPQGNQIHVILALGLDSMETLVPGITAELIAAGCEQFDESATVPRLSDSGWRCRVTGRTGLGFRRPLLEWVVRKGVLAFANVRIVHGTVGGLTLASDRSRVTGVRLRDGSEQEADLIINASGRRSKAPEWLDEHGLTVPRERFASAYMGYATQFVRVPGDAFEDGVLGIDVVPWPGQHRGGALLPADNGLHSLTAMGMMRDYPPRNREEFLAFLDDAPTPLLGQIARRCEPVSNIHVYHQDGNLRRLWEQVADLPERFLVMGDSVASFNPIYGQGMSLAAGSAVIFERVLRSAGTLNGLAKRTQGLVGELADNAFAMSGGFDASFRGAALSEDLQPPTEAQRAWSRAIDDAATEDPLVALAQVKAAIFIRPDELDAPHVTKRVEEWIGSDRRPQPYRIDSYPAHIDTVHAVAEGL